MSSIPNPTLFRDSLAGGGSYCTQECHCGRIHFTSLLVGGFNPVDPADTAHYEDLLERQKKDPKRYIHHDKECISFVEVPYGQIVDGCECTTIERYERWVWSNRRELVKYLLHRQEMENHLSDLKNEYVPSNQRRLEETVRDCSKVINSE